MARGSLPTGVVTLLFADIEGSTKLWEHCPEAMRGALVEHDTIVHETIERNCGAIFKTVGDSVCSAFSNPRDALYAAIEVQHSLHAHVWPDEVGEVRVRMALHTGVCAERDGDYYGPTVNRVARLLSIAHGQQILVSSSTAALLSDALDGATALRELGAYRLKDLSQPERTFQVLAEGLRSEFPALTSLDSRPNNLPSQISSFIGRKSELDNLTRLIAERRLLTLTGPGGIGKTRLAVQLAADVIDRYKDGVWFVDLTAIRSPDLIVQAIATQLNVRELANQPLTETLVTYIVDKALLLVIDNAEHLIAETANIIKLILSRCPAITIVATSREPLHILGEQIYRLGPLADDARLFLERAHQAAPAITFGDAEYADVLSLCRKLEGIPLAIELACARLSSMPLHQLARRLDSGMSLASKDATEQSRHRTLRDTIAWSYDLLDPGERSALTALAVFRGSCTPDAVRSVAGADAAMDDAIDSLVDKSLLQVEDARGEARYRLLDVVREYAREKLNQAGGEEAAARNHAAYYSKLVSSVKLSPARQTELYAKLDDDAPNIRAAIEWSSANDTRAAAQLICDLSPYWRVRDNITEARLWIDRVLGSPIDDEDRAALLCVAASFAAMQDELTESLRLSHEALGIYENVASRSGRAEALFRIAEAEHRKGHLDVSESFYREALAEFTSLGESRGQMLCVGNLGMLARQRGDLPQASELLEDATHRAGALGEERIAGEFIMAMGWVQLGLDELQQSRQLFERAFTEKCEARDGYGICCARHGLATVALKEGLLKEALEEFRGTLHSAIELQLKDYVARAFHGVAAVQALDGEVEQAARCLGLADRLFEESGRELRDSIAYDVAAQALDMAVPQSKQSALREEGARMRVNDAVAALQGYCVSHVSASTGKASMFRPKPLTRGPLRSK